MKSAVILSVALIASPAPAQEERGPGRIPFGRPRQWSNLMLLRMPEVQEELGSSEAQRKRLDELLRSEEGRDRGAAGKEAEEKLASILDARQLERLDQLRLQREGAAALVRPEVASRLGMTDEQKQRIQAIHEASRQEAARPQPGGAFGPPGFARLEGDRRKAEAEALAVLTEEQKAAWSSMKGKEFKFPEVNFAGGTARGPGGPMRGERKLVKEFDRDGDGRLQSAERQEARELLKKERSTGGRGGFRPRGPRGGGRGEDREPPRPGARVAPGDVTSYPDSSLYEPSILRTLFLDFEDQEWEAELADFHRTDVKVPATLTMDGKEYREVGVHFRGASSFMMVPAGYKRSLNLSIDFADPKQRLYGYRTLNLLNAHEDPSYLGTVVYSLIARQYLPAPKANLVKVVINGESWGLYVNAQQFNKEFIAENFASTGGERWKAKGSPGGGGGLDYLGEDPDEYRRRYEIKSGESEEAWKALIGLCRTLNQTPLEELEKALEPILDIDGLLWFLALDMALINNDGYWIRASDYNLFRDRKGKFHLVPHDMNEALRQAGGPGFRPGGPGGPGGQVAAPVAAPPSPGELLPASIEEALKLTDEQRKRIGELRKDLERKVEEVLTEDQRVQFRNLLEGGPAGEGAGRRARGQGGFGGGRPGEGGGGPGIELDPLHGLDDQRKPLRSRLLAIPALRTRYLEHVRTIAKGSFDWEKLAPVVERYRSLLEAEVKAETRALESYDSFRKAVGEAPGSEERPQGRRSAMSLRAFFEGRSRYLLNHPEVKQAGSPGAAPEKEPRKL